MKKLVYLLLISILTYSCSSKADELQFSKFEIKDEDKVVISVNDNGDVNVEGENIATMNADGKINGKDGNLIAIVKNDSILEDKNGKTLLIVDKNGKMDSGSGTFLSWSDKGELLEGDKEVGLAIDPADKNSFQAASIILFLHLSGNTIVVK